jgi:hypothetical protein
MTTPYVKKSNPADHADQAPVDPGDLRAELIYVKCPVVRGNLYVHLSLGRLLSLTATFEDMKGRKRRIILANLQAKCRNTRICKSLSKKQMHTIADDHVRLAVAQYVVLGVQVPVEDAVPPRRRSVACGGCVKISCRACKTPYCSRRCADLDRPGHRLICDDLAKK